MLVPTLIVSLFISSHPSTLSSIIYIGSRAGETPLLAVATEQGTVHVLNTSRRNDWDTGLTFLL